MTANGSANFIQTTSLINGDLNNTAAARAQVHLEGDKSYIRRSFALPSKEDDPTLRQEYRPFLLDAAIENSDWIAALELNSILQMVDAEIMSKGQERLKVLVLYGSLRARLGEFELKNWDLLILYIGHIQDCLLSKRQGYCLDSGVTSGYITQLDCPSKTICNSRIPRFKSYAI